MGRAPCCDKANVKRGPWSPEEDAKLREYIEKHGTGGNWIALPQKAGLKRCGKSCRLRWLNYLRPDIRHGEFSDDEDRIICTLFANIGSRWSIIAAQLPGRTDNDIKNYWNTKLKKKLLMGSSLTVPPHKIRSLHQQSSISSLLSPSSPFKCTSNNSYNPYSTLAAARSNFASDYNYETVSNLNTQSSNLLMNMETQDEFVGPMQNLYQGKLDSPVFMFGAGDRAGSCSSSDGSNCNNKEYQVDQYEQFMMFSNGSGGNIIDDEKQINGLMFKGDDQSTPLDQYNSLEEIKQLISTNYISCNSSNLNFFVDENRDY